MTDLKTRLTLALVEKDRIENKLGGRSQHYHESVADACLAVLTDDETVEEVRLACRTGFYQEPGEPLPYYMKAKQIIAALVGQHG